MTVSGAVPSPRGFSLEVDLKVHNVLSGANMNILQKSVSPPSFYVAVTPLSG